MKALRATPAEMVAELAARLHPVLVLLSSLARPTAADLLAARLRDLGREVGTAGPGGVDLGDRGFARVNDLASAAQLRSADALRHRCHSS